MQEGKETQKEEGRPLLISRKAAAMRKFFVILRKQSVSSPKHLETIKFIVLYDLFLMKFGVLKKN